MIHKKKYRHLCAFLSVLMMLFSLMPVAVFAEDPVLVENNVTGIVVDPQGGSTDVDGVSLLFEPVEGGPNIWTEVDELGSFSLALAPGAYEVRARAANGSPWTNSLLQTIVVEEDQPLNLTLSLTEPKLQGQVVSEDGTPYFDALVAFQVDNSPFLDYTYTDDQGYFKLGGVESGTYDIVVDTFTGLNERFDDVAIPRGEGLIVTFPTPTVKGQVLDPTGLPVDFPYYLTVKYYIEDQHHTYSNSLYIESENFNLVLEDGTYYLDAVPAETGAYAPSFNKKVVVSGGAIIEPVDDLVLNLTEPMVSGTVTYPDGSPVWRKSVNVNYIGTGEEPYQDYFYKSKWVHTDEQGRYTLGGLEDGEYKLSVNVPGGGFRTAVLVDNGEYDGPADIVVQMYTLEGVVRDPSGDPVPNGLVNFTSLDPDNSTVETVSADNNGIYKVVLPSGSYEAVALPPWNSSFSSSESVTIEIIEGELKQQDFTLSEALFDGQILDWNGQPVAEANITLQTTTQDDITSVNTNDEGRFFLSQNITAGEYILFVSYPRSSIQFEKLITITGEKQSETYSFENPPNLIGTVYNPDGTEVIAKAQIDYYKVEDTNGYSRWLAGTNSSGVFVGNLEDGEYYLTVQESINGTYSRSIPQKVVIAGGIYNEGELGLKLSTPIFVGQVVDDLNHSQTEGTVYFKRLGTDALSNRLNSGWTPINSDGSYNIGGIADGTYELWAELWGDGKTRKSKTETITIEGTSVTGETKLVVASINLQGTLTLPDSTDPASYVEISVYSLEDGPGWHRVAETQTDYFGQYEFSLFPGDYILRAEIRPSSSYYNQYTNSIPLMVTVPPAGTIETANLALTTPLITGKVTNQNGNVEGARVEAYPMHQDPEDEWFRNFAITDDAGNYKLGGLPPGEYNLKATLGTSYSSRATVLIPENTGYYFDLLLNESNVFGEVLGDWTDKDVFIEFTDKATGYTDGHATLKPDGTFSIYLPPGTYEARALVIVDDYPTLRSLGQEIIVPAEGDLTGLKLQIGEPQFTGSFEYADHTAATDPYVDVFKDDDYYFGQRVDGDGHFALSGLEAGNYHIQVFSQYAPPLKVPFTVDSTGKASPETFAYTFDPINLTGSVLDPEDNPVQEFEIFVINLSSDESSWYDWETEQSSESGTYSLILPDGEYLIKAYPFSDDYYPSNSIRVNVENGIASTDNPTLKFTRPPLVDWYKPFKVTKAETVRYTGSDLIAMNLAAVQGGWESSNDVVIVPAANSAEYPAALLLAGHYDAPLFIADSSGLTLGQIDELKSLGVKNVTLVGGTALLPTALENVLRTELGSETTINRIVGPDRYQTMVAASQKIYQSTKPTTLILASGNMNDAVGATTAIAGYAGKNNLALLTTNGPVILNETLNEIARLNPVKISILQGYSQVSREASVSQLTNLLPAVEVEWLSGEESRSNEMVNFGSVEKFRYSELPFNKSKVLIAPLSLQETAVAANLGSRWDTIPLLTANRVSMEIMHYLRMFSDGPTATAFDWMTVPQINIVGNIGNVLTEVYSSVGLDVWRGDPFYTVRGQSLLGSSIQINNVDQALDSYGEFVTTIKLTPGFNTINLTATNGSEVYTETREVFYQADNLQAIPAINVGVSSAGEAGIFIGIEGILDHLGKTLPDAKVAGYSLQVMYDRERVKLHTPTNLAELGQYTVNLGESTGIAKITDIGSVGTTNYQQLLFIPITLTGTAQELAPVDVFLDQIILDDASLSEVQIPVPDMLHFQKGKIFNKSTLPTAADGPDIRDGIAGLQYLAGIREAGLDPTLVNVINMASIAPSDVPSIPSEPDVADIVALMQYLAGLRDNLFNSIEP